MPDCFQILSKMSDTYRFADSQIRRLSNSQTRRFADLQICRFASAIEPFRFCKVLQDFVNIDDFRLGYKCGVPRPSQRIDARAILKYDELRQTVFVTIYENLI